MQRILTVTSLYLKFTFACMLGGTALFFLAGLAIADFKVFLVVAGISVAAFLVARMEVKSHWYARELSKKADVEADIEAIAGYLALAEATTMVLASVGDEVKGGMPSLWISEWHHNYSSKISTEGAPIDNSVLEKVQLNAAINDLQTHQKELAAEGIRILSVSKMPADQLAESIQYRSSSGLRILVSRQLTSDTTAPISIVFLHDSRTPLQIDAVQKLLQKSFQMIHGGKDSSAKIITSLMSRIKS